MTIAIERNVDDSSGARVDAARKRGRNRCPGSLRCRIGTMEQPRRHESRQERSFRLNRAVRLHTIAA